MKILLLYTPRSGTNSLCKYFLKQYPNYKFFNQPWTYYIEGDIKYTPYEECIEKDNVLIKSEISNFHKLKISKEKLYEDFDKVITMKRENKQEQSISLIYANTNSSFLNSNKRKYFIKNIDDASINEQIETLTKTELLFKFYENDSTLNINYEEFYYEKKINKVFDYLNLLYVEEDYQNILHPKNKYFIGEYDIKTRKSLL